MGKRTEYTFSQRHMDGQVYKKMLNNGIHQRNTNQKSHRVSPHICLNGIKKTGHSTCWCACGAKGTSFIADGNTKWYIFYEDNLVNSYKTKHILHHMILQFYSLVFTNVSQRFTLHKTFHVHKYL